VEKIEAQIKDLDAKIQAASDPAIKDRKRNKILIEIFDFYCKRHLTGTKGVHTFDGINTNSNNMSLADWMNFNRDFGLKHESRLQVKPLTDMFRLLAKGKDVINFEEFKTLLVKVADELAINNPLLKTQPQKLESLYNFLDLLDPKIFERMKKNNTAFLSVGPKIGLTPKEKEDLEIEKEYESLQKKKLERLLKTEIPSSILALSNKRLLKDMSLDASEDRNNKTNNQSRLNSPDHSRIISKLYYRKNGLSAKRTKNALEMSKVNSYQNARSSYLHLEKKKHIPENIGKVNWQSLDKMKDSEVRNLIHDNFEPNDLLVQDDNDDNDYLAAFYLNPDQGIIQATKTKKSNQLQNYGR